MLKGVDVSNHQSVINWSAVAGAGYAFALIKASEGTGFTDRYFVANWASARAVGMARGAYHYAQVGNAAEADADHFLSIVQPAGLQPGDLLALDLEEGEGDLSGWALAWLGRVEDATGIRPLFYSYPYFMATHGLINNPALATYPLWYASYRSTMPEPPAGWPSIAIWQNSARGRVPGINGDCDLNWFTGDSLDELRALGLASAPEPLDADAAFDAYAAAHGLGPALWAGAYARTWAGQKITRRGDRILAYAGGVVTDITGRVLDDWEGAFGGRPGHPGDLVRY